MEREPASDYEHEITPSSFINHVGPLLNRSTPSDDPQERWCAMRVEAQHVNAWNFAHGGFLATLAEIGTARAGWDPDGPPTVAIDLSIQFIAAPKLGDLVEVCGRVTKRTRTLVFTSARGEVAGEPVFVATSVQKILKG
jgi:uncharacterized protein (TIGR00369 family)